MILNSFFSPTHWLHFDWETPFWDFADRLVLNVVLSNSLCCKLFICTLSRQVLRSHRIAVINSLIMIRSLMTHDYFTCEQLYCIFNNIYILMDLLGIYLMWNFTALYVYANKNIEVAYIYDFLLLTKKDSVHLKFLVFNCGAKRGNWKFPLLVRWCMLWAW